MADDERELTDDDRRLIAEHRREMAWEALDKNATAKVLLTKNDVVNIEEALYLLSGSFYDIWRAFHKVMSNEPDAAREHLENIETKMKKYESRAEQIVRSLQEPFLAENGDKNG